MRNCIGVSAMMVLGIAATSRLAAAPATIPATPAVIPYVEPDFSAWVFSASQLKAPAACRSHLAQLLALHVANDLQYTQPAEIEQAARALGIALRLDESSRPAVLANLALRRGQRPSIVPPAGWNQDLFLKEMVRETAVLSKSEHLPDRTAAAYLYDLLLAISPANEDLLFEAEVLRQARIKPDWTWANPKRAGAVVASNSDAPPAAGQSLPAEKADKRLRPVSRFDGHRSAAHTVRVLADGATVVSADSSSLQQWELTTGKATRTFSVSGKQVVAVEVAPDGKLLYALETGDPLVESWNLSTGDRISKLSLPRSTRFFVLSADGKRALLAGFARDPQPPQLLTLPSGDIRDFAVKSAASNWMDATLSPDGRIAYLCPIGKPAFLWEIKAEKLLGEIDNSLSRAAFSPNSRRLARGTEQSRYSRGAMTIYEVEDLSRKLEMDVPPDKGASNPIFSRDGHVLLGLLNGEAVATRSSLAVWSADTGVLLAVYPLENRIARLAMSPDGKFVLTAASDGLVYVWQAPPEMDGQSERIAAPVDPEKRIEKPEFANHVKPTMRRQTNLRGLVIRQSGATAQYGFTTDIYFTMLPSPNPHEQFSQGNQVRFSRKVGPGMTAALVDAERAVRLRYPRWETALGQISFGDKTSPIDGASAGTAFALLMLSSLEGFELDPRFAVTGDITVDWRVRRIGGVGAKIRGATLDKCRCVMVPEENAAQLDDLLLSQGEKLFWDIQVFTAETLHDAVRTIRTDRPPQVQQAIEAFAKLQTQHSTSASAYRTPEGVAALKEVLKLAPNHASARMLLRAAEGKSLAKLSATAALFEAFSALEGLRLVLRNDPAAPVDQAVKNLPLQRVLHRLAEIRKISRDEVHPMIDSLTGFARAVDALNHTSAGTPEREAAVKDLRVQQDGVTRRLEELQSNHDLMEQMLREGI